MTAKTQNQAKRAALDEWTRAVTRHGGFGRWAWGLSQPPSDGAEVVHAAAEPSEARSKQATGPQLEE